MKKILSVLLVLAVLFGLTACSNSDVSSAASSQSTPSAPVVEKVENVTVPEFSIKVNGVEVTNTTMADYPLYSIVTHSVNTTGTASTTTYVGYALTDVYAAAGLKETYVWLEATADDGYTVEIKGEAVSAPTTLLAVLKDGKA